MIAPVPTLAAAPRAMEFTQTIELKAVRYRYPQASANALEAISFRIPKGRSVGIVGRSGAGKTTLMELLLGVLAPSEGEILIDDRPLDAATRIAWQSGIGYVPQLIFLSDDTLARNIAFGIPASEIDLDRVREAARLANIAQFIEEETSDGYQTRVGEGGIKLSGGQRQRVVIARALYRRPRVLVFDEATSALDSVTESAVNDAIACLQGKQTILIIAHRLSSVRHCSDILVLDHGRLVQRGSFDALTENAGVFRTMAGGVGSIA
jgi:ATP-binding cassette, subfamily B, bacterial PglK